MILSQGQALDFAPQALGETTPIAGANGYFYAEQGLNLANKFAAYGALYRRQPWVYTLATKIAKSAARLGFYSWDTSPSSGKILDKTSAYAKLWKRPCPTMPTYTFWRWTVTTYEVYGEAFWLKIRAKDNRVLGVVPMHPSRTSIERRQDPVTKEWSIWYVFAIGVASAGLLAVPEADVVPFLKYNPDMLMRGLSPLEPLNTTLFNEDASRRAQASFWTKGARPALMISAPAALSKTAYDRLASQVGKVHGGVDNAGGTLVLEEGAKPMPVQLTSEEMQYIEGRKLNREEVCAVYDMPPPAVHILDHATFSNITEQMRSVYRDTMAPELTDLESTIEFHLQPDFEDAAETSGKFALDEVLRGDFETRATAVGNLIEKGVMKPSEARPLFDLDDAGPVADKLYANSQLQELGRPAERVTITATEPPSPGEQDDIDHAEQGAESQQDAAAAGRQRTPPAAAPTKRQRQRANRRRQPAEEPEEA